MAPQTRPLQARRRRLDRWLLRAAVLCDLFRHSLPSAPGTQLGIAWSALFRRGCRLADSRGNGPPWKWAPLGLCHCRDDGPVLDREHPSRSPAHHIGAQCIALDGIGWPFDRSAGDVILMVELLPLAPAAPQPDLWDARLSRSGKTGPGGSAGPVPRRPHPAREGSRRPP